LTFVNEIDVGKIRICLGDAGPRCPAMQLRLCDGPERVAVVDGVLRGSTRRSDGSGNDNLRTDFEKVGITKSGIKREQFLPAVSVAEACGRELPKGIAGLDGDDRQFARDRFARRRRNSRNWRSRKDKRSARRGGERRRRSREFARDNGRRWQNARPFEGGPLDERPQRCDHSRSRVDHCWRHSDTGRNQGLGRRLGRREHGRVRERKMKFRGALKLLRLLFFPETASDVAERNVFGSRLRRWGINSRRGGGDLYVWRYGRAGDGLLWLLSVGWSDRLLILARFQLSAIFRRKDVVALQVFSGVNVFGFFLLAFFAGAFVTSGVCNALVFLILCLTLGLILSPVLLILGEARSGPGDREGKNQESENTNPLRAGRGLNGSQAADPGWSVEIRTCHSKPTEDGGQRLEKSIAKNKVLEYKNFL